MSPNSINLIGILDNGKGFTVITPYSTTYCDNIDCVCEDIEEFLISFMEVKKNEKQKKR